MFLKLAGNRRSFAELICVHAFEPSTKMAGKDLRELFHETLKDIYFAEKKILGALPKMAKAAQSEQLRAAFEKHEAQNHVARLTIGR
jgi:Domain of unknown function (DUF892)